MLMSRFLISAVVVAWLAISTAAIACDTPPSPPPAPACHPAPSLVEKTIFVPTFVTENHTIRVQELRPESREETYTTFEEVRETRPVERQVTVTVPETHTRLETYVVEEPIWKTVNLPYTVMVPYTELRTGTRKVARFVPVPETHDVCVDRGHWEQEACHVPCGPCLPPPVARHWVPDVVHHQVETFCTKKVMVDVPFTYPVCLSRPETRTRTERVCEYIKVPKTRKVCYTIMVPRTITKVEQETICRKVPVHKVRERIVMVPREIEKVVPVTVTKLVPKTIRIPVFPKAVAWTHPGPPFGGW